MINVHDLSKTYRVARKAAGFSASLKALFSREWTEVHAVKHLSFEIREGERVGFLGPNGAGKTTTLKILSGLLSRTSGECEVAGLDPGRRERDLLRQITLVMGQKQQLIWDLPPIETFELNRAVYDVSRKAYRQTLDEITQMLDIGDLLTKPTRQLSLGERMKCELCAALIHRPRVLFLDEPTIGLDVTMQAAVRSFIKQYNESTGATVLLTSHYMDDVQALCPRVIVIDRGELKHDGDLDRLVRRTNPHKLIKVVLTRGLEDNERELLHEAAISAHQSSDTMLSIQCSPEHLTETVRSVLATLPVADLRVEDPPLEETMRHVFGER